MAEIISIGTELMMGNITDTNSQYIAAGLTENGYKVNNISMTGDDYKKLIEAIKIALKREDLIITSGGLGPTEDDITRRAVAEAMGCKLVKKQELVAMIKSYFQKKGYTFTENNYKQAYLPEGARALTNNCGTAPGFLIKKAGKTLISLPGVPPEMRKMFTESVLPLIGDNKNVIETKTLKIFGIGESLLEDRLKDILYADNDTDISILANKGEIDIKISASGTDRQKIKKNIYKKEEKIRAKIDKYIYGENNQTLPEIVGKILKQRKKTISVAESCTGGLIGKRITEIPGSSAYFTGGMIVYSNQVKIEQLGVLPETLKNNGAVSSQTAEEMVRRVRNKFATDLAISVTGIAGPGGGSEVKPVGLVYIGLGDNRETDIYKLNLNRDRNWNRWMTSQYALYYLLQKLKIGGS